MESRSQWTKTAPADLPFLDLPTPADIVDLRYLEDNLRFLSEVQEQSHAKILFAQKSYSLFDTYPLIGRYLAGTTSSGIYEARLAHEHMAEGEIHVFSPAFSEKELDEVLTFADVVVFNSPRQWQLWREKALAAKAKRPLSFGLRLNPEYSEVEEEIYNPATPGSRLGTTEVELRKALAEDPELLEGIEGFHFHTLCEDSAETLAHTLQAFVEHFGEWLDAIKWLNWGGGHLITREGYNAKLLIEMIRDFSADYGCEIYLEPGEAIPLDCGWLMGSVLDTLENQMRVAILDVSASCHMPDVLEMPYRPRAFLVHKDGSYELAGEPEEGVYTYRLGGATCLAGDVIGDYSFSRPLERGDRIVFCDIAIYSHVKRNHFNGMPLPNLYLWDGQEARCIRNFGYKDFKGMLGEVE